MSLSRQELKTFMEARFLCVISTVSEDSRSESAYVGYTSNDGHEIIIGTSNLSRKYKNLTQNKSVSVVIADTTGEVQYEGEAEILSGEEYENLVTEGRFKALPGLGKYRDDPTQIYIKIKPIWIRFILHGPQGAGADQITEFTEFA